MAFFEDSLMLDNFSKTKDINALEALQKASFNNAWPLLTAQLGNASTTVSSAVCMFQSSISSSCFSSGSR